MMEHDVLNVPSCVLTNARPRRRFVPGRVVFSVPVYRSYRVSADAASATRRNPLQSDDFKDAG